MSEGAQDHFDEGEWRAALANLTQDELVGFWFCLQKGFASKRRDGMACALDEFETELRKGRGLPPASATKGQNCRNLRQEKGAEKCH
jgi:hypothetical protein